MQTVTTIGKMDTKITQSNEAAMNGASAGNMKMTFFCGNGKKNRKKTIDYIDVYD